MGVIVAGPLALLRFRKFNDVLDGATFGAVAGATFVGAQILAQSIDLLTAGAQPGGDTWSWVLRILEHGVAVPLIAAGARGRRVRGVLAAVPLAGRRPRPAQRGRTAGTRPRPRVPPAHRREHRARAPARPAAVHRARGTHRRGGRVAPAAHRRGPAPGGRGGRHERTAGVPELPSRDAGRIVLRRVRRLVACAAEARVTGGNDTEVGPSDGGPADAGAASGGPATSSGSAPRHDQPSRLVGRPVVRRLPHRLGARPGGRRRARARPRAGRSAALRRPDAALSRVAGASSGARHGRVRPGGRHGPAFRADAHGRRLALAARLRSAPLGPRRHGPVWRVVVHDGLPRDDAARQRRAALPVTPSRGHARSRSPPPTR